MNRRACVGAVLGLLAIGCIDDGGTEAFEQDEALYRQEVVRIGCGRARQCLRPLSLSLGAGVGDLRPSACEAVSHGDVPALRQSIEAGRVVYHPEQLQACLAADEARDCTELSAHPDACLMAFEGQVPIGETCTITYDCEGDAICETDLLTPIDERVPCAPRCRARLPQGEPCTHPLECERGLRCLDPEFEPGSGSSVVGAVCSPPAAQGARCHGLQCEEGLVCILDLEQTLLTCEPFERGLAQDVACSARDQCADDLGCRADDASGERACASGTAGMPCTQDSECALDQACGCLMPDCIDAGDFACRPWPGEGEGCVHMPSSPTGGGPRCGAGLACLSNDRCGAPRKQGEACQQDLDCEELRCLAGRCAARQCE